MSYKKIEQKTEPSNIDNLEELDLFECQVANIDEDTRGYYKICKKCNTFNWKQRKQCYHCKGRLFRSVKIQDIDALWADFGPENYILV